MYFLGYLGYLGCLGYEEELLEELLNLGLFFLNNFFAFFHFRPLGTLPLLLLDHARFLVKNKRENMNNVK